MTPPTAEPIAPARAQRGRPDRRVPRGPWGRQVLLERLEQRELPVLVGQPVPLGQLVPLERAE
jgi:hypothetical protein